MEKEFVHYELAVKLKALGFNEPCAACYYKKFDNEIGYHKVYRDFNFVQLTVSAPTYSQAFRFFREKYDWQHSIDPTADQHSHKLGYNYWIWNYKTGEEHYTIPKNRPTGDWEYETYEEAEVACLDKLIELIEK